ncbi:MAG: 2Fe-2S iron-sulfur cluster-binding protein, partial [Acidimicrobiia bacterium]
MSETVQVVFTPSGRRHRVAIGSTVLDAARDAGVDLDSVCGGRGICGRCQIELGSAPGVIGVGLSEPGTTEQEYRGKRPLLTGRRLGCAAQVLSDIVINVPPDSQLHRQVVRKRPEAPDIQVDPVVRLYYVEVDEPRMDDPAGEQERLAEALQKEWALSGLQFDLHVTGSLHAALQAGHR